ncbi:MAG: alpha/beta fold hydrolase [Pseudomonadota bacterium]|nr:alpha/beta fold hydrolase [Pseudomonadota bacterium]
MRTTEQARADRAASAIPPATSGATIALIDGAFDAPERWERVVACLKRRGRDPLRLADPCRCLIADAARLAAAVRAIPGPVVLVGHSHAAAIIADVAAEAINVTGLVYVAAPPPAPGHERARPATPAEHPCRTLTDRRRARPHPGAARVAPPPAFAIRGAEDRAFAAGRGAGLGTGQPAARGVAVIPGASHDLTASHPDEVARFIEHVASLCRGACRRARPGARFSQP